MASLGLGDLRPWVGIVTSPVEQHKAGGTLGAPTQQPPKGPHYGGHEGQLLWHKMLLQRQPQECSGGGSTMPQGWGFSLSLSTSCASTNEEPGKKHCGRLTQGSRQQRPSHSWLHTLAHYPQKAPKAGSSGPIAGPQRKSVEWIQDVCDDVSKDNLLPL